MRVRFAAVIALLALPLLAGEPDRAGCKDHPMFSRMPGYRISWCDAKEFDAVQFFTPQGKETTVEGRVYKVDYQINEGATAPGRVQIVRNYQNAIARIGGTTVHSIDDAQYFMKLAKDGKEFFVVLDAYNNNNPSLTIVEKQVMRQDVVAKAEALGGDLKSSGHVAIYGIYFDSNSAEVKPQSKAALDEIGKLLKNDPALKLYVVGHTDGTGVFDSNLRLSQARAESVVKALTTQYGVAAARLKAHGVGPAAPVATNETEEGKAKNRRVELVKQ